MSIAPEDVRRAVRALLRAFPSTTRIHLEVLFPPHELGLPARTISSADDMVIALPSDLDGYLASLGTSTRRNLRTYENRLRRAFPDVSTEIIEVGDRATELFDVYLAWKRPRLAAQGKSVYFDVLPDRKRRFVELLRRRGEGHITSVQGRTVAVLFTFPVGPGCSLAQYAYDPDLDYYHLGLLTQYWTIADAIARGMRQVSMLPGTSYYKERLGAAPERGTHLSVFPSQFARLHSAGEAWEVGRRRLRQRSSTAHWGARHRVRELAGPLLHRAGDGQSH
jgi:CelD/BcsL family acetyltransferase involved in cellulose biosynthesis